MLDDKELSPAEVQYRSIFENAVEGIYQTTLAGRYLRVNPALARIYGYETPQALIVGLTDIAGQLYVDPTRRDAFKQTMARDGLVTDFEAQVYRRDGSVIWITENARAVRDANGSFLYYEGTVEDISRRKADEEKIRLLAAVFETVRDGILIIDRKLIVRAVNPAYQTLSGYDAESLLGEPIDMLAPGQHESNFFTTILRELWQTGHWTGEAACHRRTGEPFAAALSLAVVREGDSAPSHIVITCADISRRKEQEEHIWRHANYDTLTQLPNRYLLGERLQQAMLRAQRNKSGLAILFLDLNGFKQVNDGLGHAAGDELLRLVAKRLQSSTRGSDIVGRLGGDEFLMVAPDVTERAAAFSLCEKILYSFADPFRLAGREIYCQPAIGIAFYPGDGEDADTLIRNADIAMYAVKARRADRFASFTPAMHKATATRLELENELHRAFDERQLVLHFQPKVEAHSGLVVGAEALVRWQHPTRGLVPPTDFIPMAEECGLIMQIGEWTLREACRHFIEWQKADLAVASVAVNLSPSQFLDAKLVSMVAGIIAETGIEPAALELELTEGAMSVDIEKAITTLESLRALGVKLSVDDFGTGYSSLAYLKRLPLDVVKIDRSFVKDLGINPADGKIVAAIVDLASVLGFRVVAEGVETDEQASILRATDCDLLQGYLFSRPVEPHLFVDLARASAQSRAVG